MVGTMLDIPPYVRHNALVRWHYGLLDRLPGMGSAMSAFAMSWKPVSVRFTPTRKIERAWSCFLAPTPMACRWGSSVSRWLTTC